MDDTIWGRVNWEDDFTHTINFTDNKFIIDLSLFRNELSRIW